MLYKFGSSKSTLIEIEIRPNSIFVKGHSGFDEKGKDIVCAAISSLTLGSIHIWSKRNDFEYCKVSDDSLRLIFKWNLNNEDLKQQYLFLVKHYKIVSENYPKYVSYTEIED